MSPEEHDPLQYRKAVPGPPTDGAAVYGTYVRWCQRAGKPPVDEEIFIGLSLGADGKVLFVAPERAP